MGKVQVRRRQLEGAAFRPPNRGFEADDDSFHCIWQSLLLESARVNNDHNAAYELTRQRSKDLVQSGEEAGGRLENGLST